MPMGLVIYQVDAFTSQPFAGNPAAVCILTHWPQDEWLQRVAMEMNLAETAFLVPASEGYRLRWFTPAVEVDLCGHATLASAHVLWETGVLPQDATAHFTTRSGPLSARRRDGGIEMDFPACPATEGPPPPLLTEALGVPLSWVGRNGMDYLVELANEDMVRRLRPNMGYLATLPVRGLIVTAKATTPGYDFVSRFFAPAAGVPEDPVTGSAHCCLGPFWQTRLGKSEFVAYQASSRGGVVRVHCRGPRVLLGGEAVTVLRGELLTGPPPM
jgi:PhzF family phenazine biosynthesis protein